ncbi:MAG: hypothetical protein M3N18_04860 [Actinomycetota bacterium]|nr:hypothetical protein [Actinomycetota bacterium]
MRLDADLPPADFESGAEGIVTSVILGSPISYLVEFRVAGPAPRRR